MTPVFHIDFKSSALPIQYSFSGREAGQGYAFPSGDMVMDVLPAEHVQWLRKLYAYSCSVTSKLKCSYSTVISFVRIENSSNCSACHVYNRVVSGSNPQSIVSCLP